jgi:AcrR family transcriptional regulator
LRTALANGEVATLDSIWIRRERAATGRPAQHSRAGITAVALGIADREGLDAVSMRRVAAELGTGAASLYRYVRTREELLDLMTDAVGAEYDLAAPSGDWLADLIAFGEQLRAILRRHRWLAGLTVTRPVIGPNGLALIEHVLEILRPHPAGIAAKLEAFAMVNGITAAFALQEQSSPDFQERTAAYLQHAIASGAHPRLAELIAPAGEQPADRYPDLMSRILTGILGPGLAGESGGARRGRMAGRAMNAAGVARLPLRRACGAQTAVITWRQAC